MSALDHQPALAWLVLLAGTGLIGCAAAVRTAPLGEPVIAEAPGPRSPARWVPPPPPPSPSTPRPWPEARELTLPSGLRVVVVAQRRRPVVVVRLVLPRGSLADPPDLEGVGLLAVQLAGDLREKSPAGEPLHWEKSLRRQVLDLGGVPALELGSERTLLEISGYAQDTEPYLGLLADAVRNPRHGAEAFQARRNATLDALEDQETSDPVTLQQRLAEAAFGDGHPYARAAAGTLATVGKLGLEDVVAQQARLFVPRGATLLVVGAVEPPRVFAQARAAFAHWSGDPVPPPAFTGGAEGRGEVGFLRREPASTLLACATRAIPEAAGSEAALDVLAAWLGRGLGSQLMRSLREERGLTYDASARVVRRLHGRALLACSSIAADRAEEGLRAFRSALEEARRTPPDPAALERARALRLAELESSADDTPRLADAWTRALVLGRSAPNPVAERAVLERVGAAELGALARAVLEPGGLRWILSGDARVAARAAEAGGLGRLRTLSPQR